ncbi:NAD(P)-dependent dehydrogenase (short-subunit alcohol dehydrogenase family) [Paenibacillus sp. JGP012]|nr:NAD(P)-dependent dehydrogenase (short-subunit alcohol dehydrogenase family) [Paenibacillus sp. JGP012]
MNKSKIVLITGGNKGIGFETARQLGNMGYEILIGARSEEKGHEAVTHLEPENINAKTVVLDVTKPSSVLKNTYETNVFGVFSVTKALLPLLQKSSAGRIVNLSSALGSLTLNSDPTSEFYNVNSLAYNSSKTAVML